MGAVCSPCVEDIQAASKLGAAHPATGSRGPSKRAARQQADAGPQHDVQVRANLTVKDGGFALKNFMPTNAGKLDQFFDVGTEKIGEGGFGAVRKGKDKRTGRECAVKFIQKSNKDTTARLKEEIEIMRVLDHPNIIRFHESFEDKRTIYICLELCEGGELFERICEAGHFSEVTAARCVRQMLLAINYLHQNFIMHRDLKPENWLLANRDPVGEAPIKLIDFGISKRFQPGDFQRTKAGTPNYVAPEVLNGRYDEKADVWSSGVICYMMLSGRHPFSGKTVSAVLRAVKNGMVVFEASHWKSVSNEAKGFVKASLQKSPAVRPSASMALGHEWFSASAREDRQALGTLEISGLKSFGRMHQLKRAACTVIATQLSHCDIAKLKALFLSLDKNGDGSLAPSELKAGLKASKIKLPMDLNELLEEADTDGSGVIDYTEFIAATMDRKLYRQEEVVWNAFQTFDADGSGFIDRKELAKVLGDDEVMDAMHTSGQQDRLIDIFAQVDSNNDGMIDFQEFFSMMRAAEDGQAPLARAQVGGSSPRSPRAPAARSPRNKSTTSDPSKSRGGATAGNARSPRGGGSDNPKDRIGLASAGWDYAGGGRAAAEDEKLEEGWTSTSKHAAIF